jgi:hypothetical protein
MTSKSIALIQKRCLEPDRLLLLLWCSLVRSPCDLDLRDKRSNFQMETIGWLSRQIKVEEVVVLPILVCRKLQENDQAIFERKHAQTTTRKDSYNS